MTKLIRTLVGMELDFSLVKAVLLGYRMYSRELPDQELQDENFEFLQDDEGNTLLSTDNFNFVVSHVLYILCFAISFDLIYSLEKE